MNDIFRCAAENSKITWRFEHFHINVKLHMSRDDSQTSSPVRKQPNPRPHRLAFTAKFAIFCRNVNTIKVGYCYKFAYGFYRFVNVLSKELLPALLFNSFIVIRWFYFLFMTCLHNLQCCTIPYISKINNSIILIFCFNFSWSKNFWFVFSFSHFFPWWLPHPISG